MRITSGQFGGRVLRAPTGHSTRPTSERVRQAVFNTLGTPPPDCRVLDLFAGSGAMGLEALSRGAAHCVFVDTSRGAIASLQRNIETLEVASICKVLNSDALTVLGTIPATPWNWVFIDPPYRSDLAAQCGQLLSRSHLAEDAVIVIEHDRRNPTTELLAALTRTDVRRYGDTEISYYRLTESI
jgi:16S rRNA (guanine966-N2)-methyltransferase